ncbi:hypothetical protein EYE40_13180 [Glaciihabitans arcticus]|uniref:alpha-L-rhamnosidase n=1 Tax=Glaciihabitans arcticus TaxID=2668039 RepID=A0A4Q9GU58_9MICO|nr:family 78 glycoside hydrolase catalytic domain [Glaciihabitans arcticus]TBN58271.1 hypothetical protein EYE40_13180 [Glaciihabitans arcticus]
MTVQRFLTRPTRVAALALTMALIVGGTTIGAGAASAADAPLAAAGLRTDSLVNPLGINGDDPEFTWQLKSDTRATLQTAHRIVVSSTRAKAAAGDADVWNPGWVSSEQSVDVTYAGPALESATPYYWAVQVRDNHGRESALSTVGSFETALLAASEWDADWIGEDSEAALNQWKDYSVELSASSITGALGVYLRANASASNAYMWQISVSGTDAFIRPHIRTNGNYNVPTGTKIDPTFLNGPITSTTANTFRFDVVGNSIATYVNDHLVVTTPVTNFARGYVGFRSSAGESGTAHSLKVTTVGAAPKTLVNTAFPLGDTTFTGGSQTVAGSRVYAVNDGLLNGLDTEPIFRSDFTAGSDIASARLYASALGVYEFRINGERVGDLELAPGWTDYNKRVAFQTYDVTDLVKTGDNAIGALTGAGWYSGSLGWFGPNQYGTDSRLLGQLVITYADGSQKIVGTDGDWTTTKGPVLASDLLMGETYDANKWQDGWDEAGFDDSSWNAVLDAGALATSKLEPQPEPPVRITQELAPITLTNVNGAWVYDLGQNMVGKVRLNVGANANNGARITLKHAEILHADGSVAMENLRSAKATDYFTPVAGGGAQTYVPRFTYHGFRYVELTGFVGTPTLATITGLVEGSDNEATSTFDSSSTMLNKLQKNIVWGQRGNFFSVPTDTPARDERLGWTGDINVFAPTAAFNMYSEEFLRKWMTDMRDAQHANGAYPEVAPQFCKNPAVHDSCDAGSTGWADAGVTVPFVVWQNYGDTGIITENWDSMVDYIDFLDAQAVNNVRPGYGHWGDWLNLSDPTPGNVLGTAFYAHSVDLMAQMATATGRTAEATAYTAKFAAIKAAYQDAFVAADGTVTGGSQTAYAISIGMGLVPESLVEAAGTKLAARVAAKGGHLSTGFLGTPYLLPALTQSGQEKVAYSLMMSETAPSWGYEVAMGATTMWEKWDSLGANGQPTDYGMNSFNHYAFGAVGDWMYQTIGGIRSTEPGFKHSVIAPQPGGGLTHAAVGHTSVYGRVASDWTITGGRMALTVDVPANTTSTVRIAAKNLHEVFEGDVAVADAVGVESVTLSGSDAVIEVGSGHYAFSIDEVAGTFGTITDGLAAIDDALDGAGLSVSDRALADGYVDDARAAVGAADAATTDSAAALAVHTALARLASLTTLLIAAESDAELLDAVAEVSADLSGLSAGFLDVSASIVVSAGAVSPSGTATATIAVENDGDSELASVDTSLTAPAGWKVLSLSHPVAAVLAPGATREGAYSVRVAAAGPLGSNPLAGTATYRFNGSTATIPVTGAVSVTSPISLTASAIPAAAPGSAVTANVTVTNASGTAVRGTLQTASAGWRIASGEPVTVPSNGSLVVPVTLQVDETANGGAASLVLAFAVGGETWSSVTVGATVNLSLDGPTLTQYDYVDVGEAVSEAAHEMTKSNGSGVTAEAGRSRRYVGITDPTGFMQYRLAVPAGKPFTLKLTETYDRNQTKDYRVLVNGTLVQRRINVHTGGLSLVTYSIPVSDTTLSASGSVVVRIENNNPLVPNTYDPSIADLWTTAFTDYVDLGNTASETAHATTFSSRSGTNTEAGRTRRYADRLDPNGFIQFTAKIEQGKPFTIQTVDTFDGPQRKVYDVFVNGTKIERHDYTRTASGAGLATTVVLVDNPALLTSGTVTLRFQSESSGTYYDPSLADVWVTPAAADTLAPSLEPVVTGEIGAGGWYTSEVTVDATARDNRRAPVTVEHKLGSADWTAHSGAVTVSDEGDTAIGLRATDAAGNAGAIDTLDLRIDSVAPSVNIDGFQLEVDDETSGLASVRYRLADGPWAAFEGDVFVFDGAGTFRVEVVADDVAGNRTHDVSYITIDDATDPEVTLTTSLAPVGGWLPADATVALEATDDVGIATLQYRLPGSDWKNYTAPLEFEPGKHTVTARAVDFAGNTSAIATLPVWIDGTAPVTASVVAGNPSNRDRLDVRLTATDAESGVAATKYSVDGDDWVTLEGSTVTVTGYGRHTVEFASTDRVGNVEKTRSVAVSIKDVDALINYTKPTMTGTAKVGSTLTATTGTWNTTGLDIEIEWLRGGVVIPNAGTTTYLITPADIGKTISVRVTASKPELLGVAVTTAATVAIPKVVTVTTLTASKTSVTRNSTVVLSMTVSAPVGTPAGTVTVYLAGKKFKTVTLVNGQATLSVKFGQKKTYVVGAVYAGSTTYAGDSSPNVSIKVK